MFDVGFAELLLIAVVGLLVIGPERLPGAIRTGSTWINRAKRGLAEVNADIQRELHNDAVLRDLRETEQQINADLRAAGEQADSSIEAAKANAEALLSDKGNDDAGKST